MEENSTPPPTTIQKSYYTRRVEAVAKELIALVESRKDESDTGLILISVNTEKGADKEEVVISIAGSGRALRTGLRLFADQDPKMGMLFDKVAADRALRRLLTKLT